MGAALLNTTTEAGFTGTALDSEAIAVPTLRRIAKDGAPQLQAGVEARQPVAVTHPASAEVLRMQVAERLAAHRRRRTGAGGSSATTSAAEPVRSGGTRSARIAATVAERYAHTPSYRAFLAAEAELAIEQARAAAEVAAMNAQAIADAQQRMLDAFDEAATLRATKERAVAAEVQVRAEDGFGDTQAAMLPEGGRVELNLWPDVVREEARRGHADAARRSGTADLLGAGGGRHDAKAATAPSGRTGGFTVRLYEDAVDAIGEHRGVTHRAANLASSLAHTNRREYRNEDEAIALDEEIAFRQAPVFEEPAGPPVPLPANLIEFPRQLVASRKARPRLAEGPLREEGEAAPGDGQLRIFEVDTAQISTQPTETAVDTPQWTSIWLDTPREAVEREYRTDFEHRVDQAGDAIAVPFGRSVPAVQAASIVRRIMAGGIDLGIVIGGVLAFATAFVAIADRSIAWQGSGSMLQTVRVVAASIASQTGMQPSQVGIIGGAAGVFLMVAYHALFFWFSDATPGMRCARIALCTFDDENPTPRAIRRRLGAMLLSACTLGFGFVWAMLDEERLTWHDRITRMYLRGY